MNEKKLLYFKSSSEWRKWLEVNHDKVNEAWLVYFKKHMNKPTIKYDEAVEEGLCYGWIDSKVNSLDNELYMQKYRPIKQNSMWSLLNKKRALKMIKEGKMTNAPIKQIEEAKKNGSWDNAYSSSEVPEMPDDLRVALRKNKNADNNFYLFSKSAQTIYIRWVNAAKRDETRKRRIRQAVQRGERNHKPGIL